MTAPGVAFPLGLEAEEHSDQKAEGALCGKPLAGGCAQKADGLGNKIYQKQSLNPSGYQLPGGCPKTKKYMNSPPSKFGLLLFSVNQDKIREAIEAGVDGIVVDWENQGKKLRQQNFDTQINHDTYQDLCRVRDLVPADKLICRINGFSPQNTPIELDRALEAGADEILMPMVVSAEEVQFVLSHVGNEKSVSILIETTAALTCLDQLAELPLKRVYVGLNDLHIQQNSRNIFVPLVEGTVEGIGRRFSVPLGAGGVTNPACGLPIASRYLIEEYARLGVSFSFLRRSFLKDSLTTPMASICAEIREHHARALRRSPHQILADQTAFREKVENWQTKPERA